MKNEVLDMITATDEQLTVRQRQMLAIARIIVGLAKLKYTAAEARDKAFVALVGIASQQGELPCDPANHRSVVAAANTIAECVVYLQS